MQRILSSALLCLICGMSGASELPKWGDVGDWEIHIDPAIGNGCFIEKLFPDGTLVQFGNEPLREGGFFAAYNITWTEIKQGDVSTVKFDFDGDLFSGEATGQVIGTLHGGRAFFDNPNIALDFARKNLMTITGARGNTVEIPLKGTSAALKKLNECQLMQPLPKVEGSN
ncbi:hypothetical protein LCL97_20125 [Seohaeicola saemankumensis]|nr:hypothetical protein [Seohaeicola saemankumensis]MCA0873143.1 hypothetical protein [Seohaeicola saemankumensis]